MAMPLMRSPCAQVEKLQNRLSEFGGFVPRKVVAAVHAASKYPQGG